MFAKSTVSILFKCISINVMKKSPCQYNEKLSQNDLSQNNDLKSQSNDLVTQSNDLVSKNNYLVSQNNYLVFQNNELLISHKSLC